MLNMIKVDLELIPDSDMFILFEKCIWKVEFVIFLIDIAKPTIKTLYT